MKTVMILADSRLYVRSVIRNRETNDWVIAALKELLLDEQNENYTDVEN